MEASETIPAVQNCIVTDGDAPQPKTMRRWLSFAVGLMVSAVFLYLAMRSVNFEQLRSEAQGARYPLLALAMVVITFTFVVRVIRWQVLFGKNRRAALRPLFTSMMIGYLANNVLPARAGELVRIYVLERRTGVSKSTSAATVILERLADVLVLLALVGVMSFFVPLPALMRSGSRIATVGCLAFALLLLYVAIKGQRLISPITHLVEAISPGLGHKLQSLLTRFADGLSVLRNGRQLVVVLGLTLMVWLAEAVTVGLVILSLNLSVPRIAALFVLLAISLSAIIPTAPGAVGTYEFFTVAALAPFAVSGNQAFGLALLLHVVGYVTVALLGFASLWVESLSLRELVSKTDSR